MDFGGLLSALGGKMGFGGALDLATKDPSKLMSGGLLGLADKADINFPAGLGLLEKTGFPAGLGIANNLGAGGLGMAALAGSDDIAGQAMKQAAAETPKPFDLKGLATDLNSLAKQQEANRAETEAALDSAMAQTMSQAGSGLIAPPQGAMPASPMAQNAQIARSANPSGAAQAIMGGTPMGVGIGAQPSVQEAMRRIYGR